ncbi:ATP-binding cassette domain-containing protein [Janibacter sp. YIM B02568]|uniref:ABC transporter ATP-binding protein n=1 Tax=Janibacter endophyticus TaxID=2806261 RepID=UPI0019520A57|nr:ATP-binding cassette domain-containing protein [Janibacter endophyticus]MBM6546773.1 ATP-binding cassette domain-containing protein [Janibacter endophyticus]
MILFDHVSVTYDGAPEPTLRDVSFEVDEGELVLVVGRTGSGKSTLLGAINGTVPHFTGGTLAGRVTVAGRDTRDHRPRDLADVVGVVGQDPLAGFVTDTVETELAYGMEQLALPAATMRKRVEETLDVLGIADLRDAPLRDLSGGQQQRVAIGSVLTIHPRVLVLDEPTSALDPTGAEEVLAAITRLVHDLATTVVIAEHRIERVVQYADSVIHVADDRAAHGDPATLMADATVAPPVVELGRLAGWTPLPLSVRDARRRAAPLRSALAEVSPKAPEVTPSSGSPALDARGVVVRYGRLVAVKGVDLTLEPGTVTALMGRNGCGKSSLLWALQGSGARAEGVVRVARSGAAGEPDPASLPAAERRALVGMVPQTASDLLYLDTVDAECAQADAESGSPAGTCAALLERLAPGIPGDRHPRDLSEGQRLSLVLAIQLTAQPPVILLDEPTRGLDYTAKAALRDIVHDLAAQGRTVLLSTHDVEFVAETAARVVVMAEGEVVADGPTADVVVSSPAFAPQVAKIMAPQRWLTVDEVRDALRGNGIGLP